MYHDDDLIGISDNNNNTSYHNIFQTSKTNIMYTNSRFILILNLKFGYRTQSIFII